MKKISPMTVLAYAYRNTYQYLIYLNLTISFIAKCLQFLSDKIKPKLYKIGMPQPKRKSKTTNEK